MVSDNLDEMNVTSITTSELAFPNYRNYPSEIKDLFEYFRSGVTKADLENFALGNYLDSSIVNLYFKVLEKINLLNLSYYYY